MLAPATGVSFPVFAMETGSLVLLPPENQYIWQSEGSLQEQPLGQEEGDRRKVR